jgi:hypothetical protein
MASNGKSWNDLPTALQRKVLEYRLVFERPITLERHDSIIRRALLPLVLANRQLHLLATQTYYESNTFIVLHHSGHGRLRYLRFPSHAVGQWIRKLELRVDVALWRSSNSLDAMLASPSCCLGLLFIPNEPHRQYSPSLTAWQRRFPDLDEMKLELIDEGRCDLADHTPNETYRSASGEMVVVAKQVDLVTEHDPIQFAWLDQVHVHIKPKKVEVVVEGLVRRSAHKPGEPARDVQCECAQRVCELFKSLLEGCNVDQEVDGVCPAVSQQFKGARQTDENCAGQDVNTSSSQGESAAKTDQDSSKFSKAYANYVGVREKSLKA